MNEVANLGSSDRKNNKSIHVRTNFLLFIKVLLRYLDKSQGDELLLEQSKLIVFRYRMLYCNQPDQMRSMMSQELRALVGEATWERAMKLTGFYLRKQSENQTRNTNSMESPQPLKPQPIVEDQSLLQVPLPIFGIIDEKNDKVITTDEGLIATPDLLSTLEPNPIAVEPNPIAVGLPFNSYPMDF